MAILYTAFYYCSSFLSLIGIKYFPRFILVFNGLIGFSASQSTGSVAFQPVALPSELPASTFLRNFNVHRVMPPASRGDQMQELEYAFAASTLGGLNLCPSNWQLASYWLSLCADGRMPRREDFQPRFIKTQLAGLAIFELNHCGTAFCRLAGTAIDRGLGFSLVGKDFMSFLSHEEKPIRLLRLRSLVGGSVGVARTSFDIGGDEFIEENLLLPFGGVTETGSQQFLLHTNIR